MRDVCLNRGPTIGNNIIFAITKMQSAASINYLVVFKNIDILAITETWLTPNDPVSSIFKINLAVCTFLH